MSPVNKHFAGFAQWIWDKRVNNKAILPSVLTEWNKDESLPQPALSDYAALSLLLWLEEAKLMFPVVTPEGTAYSVNHLKEREWIDAITELKKPVWLRSSFLKRIKKILAWIVLLAASVFLADMLHDFYKTKIRSRVFQVSNIGDSQNQGK
jgi:hypothetical protein